MNKKEIIREYLLEKLYADIEETLQDKNQVKQNRARFDEAEDTAYLEQLVAMYEEALHFTQRVILELQTLDDNE